MAYAWKCVGALTVALLLCGCVTEAAKIPGSPEKVVEQEGGPDVEGLQQTWLASAEKARENGEFRKAAGFYEMLLGREEGNRDYLLAHAEMLRRAGDAEAALEQYEVLLKHHPVSAEALEGKGLALMAKAEFREAAQLFSKVMGMDAARWRTANALGIIYSMDRKTKEAIEYYKAALKLNPDHPSILNNLGLSLAIQGQYDKAVKALKLASGHLKPGDVNQKRVDLNLALVYGISGQMEEAAAVAKQHLTEAALYNNLGFYAHLAEDRELARTYLNMALSKSEVHYDKAWENLQKIAPDVGR